MSPQNFAEEARHSLAVIWHWSWLIILVTALAGLAALLISKSMPLVYQASTTILVSEAPVDKSADYTSILTSERLAQTYAQLIIKQPVLEKVIQETGVEMDLDSLQDAVSAQTVRDTQLILIQVEHKLPQRAAELANAIVAEFGRQNQELQADRYRAPKASLEAQIAQLDTKIASTNLALAQVVENAQDNGEQSRLEANLAQYNQTYNFLLQSYEQVRLAEAQSTSSIYQVEPAVIPTRPVRPRVLANTILACIAGLLLSVGIVVVRETLDDTLRNPQDINQLQLPVLGAIARDKSGKVALLVNNQPRSPIAEAYRSLRTNIRFACVDRPLRTLLVTSPSPSEGKSTVAVNLAIVMAQDGDNVVMFECDLRRPKLHEYLRVSNTKGLSDHFIESRTSLGKTLQETGVANLSVLASGPLPPNPSELLGSRRMVEILSLVAGEADFVILDSPPVLAVTDAVILAPRVDGVLLVIKPGVTKIAAVRQTVEQLRRVGANLVGVVLNEVKFKHSGNACYHYQGYYFTYTDRYGSSAN